MSLVDYASSSDDDISKTEAEAEAEEQQHKNEQSQLQPSPPRNRSKSSSSSNQQSEIGSPSSLPPPFEALEKLPDASILLNSATSSVVSGNDHASRVAAAMAESATRKRDSKGLPSTLPRSKIPKGTLPHSKNVLDTAGGLLLPPQLSGRSNIVTEDITKLFVRKHTEPSRQ